jgi:hypothetical protein
MKQNHYEKLWNEEYKAHKWTIEKNLELKNTVNRLVKINDKLITLNTTLTKDREILLIEVGRLKKLIKEENYD